jgi:hypothetical protein
VPTEVSPSMVVPTSRKYKGYLVLWWSLLSYRVCKYQFKSFNIFILMRMKFRVSLALDCKLFQCVRMGSIVLVPPNTLAMSLRHCINLTKVEPN